MKVDYDGATLIDSTGEHVGKIERSYLGEDGTPQFLEVRTGTILAKHHLVPAEQAEALPEGVRVPYTRDVIEESPSASSGATLEGNELEEIRAYYAHDFGADDSGEESEADKDLRNRPPHDYDNTIPVEATATK